MAAALRVVEYLRDHDVPGRAARAGERLRALLRGIASRHPLVTGVRRMGLLPALGLRSSPGRSPGTSLDPAEAAREEGLLVHPTGIGPRWESILVAPPLTVSDVQPDDLAGRLDAALPRPADRPPGDAEMSALRGEHTTGSAGVSGG